MDQQIVVAIFNRIDRLRENLECGQPLDEFATELRQFRDEVEALSHFYERVALYGRIITS